MTECVVEVGPGTVRGPRDVAQNLVSAALECVDDEIALLDEQPVAVAAVWREVFRSVLPDRIDTAVLVCPTWWPPSRVERVRDAAAKPSVNVVVLQRAQVLAGDAPGVQVVVEIAPEFVVIARTGCVVMAEPRIGDPADVARTVADGVGAATAVLVDAPIGVDGAVGLAGAIAECLRTDGVAVTTAPLDGVLTAARHEPMVRAHEWGPAGRRRPLRVALSAVAASVALLCVGLSVGFDVNGSPGGDVPVTLLVEGRVAVKVPALWDVRRITSGPGSARVEVTASDDTTAVLITQSQIRKGESLAATAATLRRALDDQQAGVFSEFNPDDRRADRPAATYRELRDGRQIDWTVFVDDTVRIAIGCQGSPDSQQVVRDVCEEAIRSAHAVV